jgi:uncharacterized delta-60 repeat protein
MERQMKARSNGHVLGATMLVAACVLAFSVSCENPVLARVQAAVPTPAPEISPAGGSFVDSREVTLSCATAGATIRYTTDGSDPATSATAQDYSAPFQLNYDCPLKVAAKGGMRGWSATVQADFGFSYSTWGLDPNFNSEKHNGYTMVSDETTFSLWCWNSAALQSDGKIVVLGSGLVDDPADAEYPRSYPCVARFTTSGDLDTGFGKGGFALVNVDSTYCYGEGQSIAVDDQDRIYFQGFKSTDKDEAASIKCFVGRLLSNGALDTTYAGGTGVYSTPDESDGASYWGSHLLAVDPHTYEAFFIRQDKIYKVKAEGVADSSFGTNGVLSVTDLGTSLGFVFGGAYGVGLRSNELIVSTFAVDPGTGKHVSGVFGLSTTNGAITTTRCALELPSSVPSAEPADFCLAPDGSMLVAQIAILTENVKPVPDDLAYFISKVDASGTKIAAGWGKTEGKGTLYNYAFEDDWPYTVALQKDGAILVGGKTMVSGSKVWTLWRLASTGAPRSYTIDREHFGVKNSFVRSIVVQPDGRFIAVGAAGGCAIIARYLP